MKVRAGIAALSAGCLLMCGCSSRPREFAATLDRPAADEAAYRQAVQTCRALVGKGYKSSFRANAATIGSGAVAGIGGGLVAGSIAASATTPTLATLGTNSIAAGVGAFAIALPIIGAGVGFGVSRAIRSGRERRVKTALTACLGEYGHNVSGWTVVKKARKAKPDAPSRAAASTGP